MRGKPTLRRPKQVDGSVDSDERKKSEYLYTVEIEHGEKKVIVRDVPRDDNGVELVDKAYSQMWHMKNAFRNKMYIPDDMFPESWMNLP